MRKLRPQALVTAALFTVAALGQTIASAGTFPGTNGKIAFATGHIEVINADGTGRVTLDAASPASTVNEPAWNATGTKLVFRKGGSSFSTMNADGSNVKPLFSYRSFAGNPTWSPDGSVIAFDGFIGGIEQENRIFIVPAAGGTATELVALDAEDPTYSPDGTKIAYEESAASPDIGVMNADGSGAANITTGAGAGDLDPSWSPDGTRIAFTRAKQIWTMNADGSGATQLTTGADSIYPTWSPDGTKIAFERDADIWVMDSDGSSAANITNTPDVEDRAPDWGMGGALPPSEGIGFAADAYEVNEGGGSAAGRTPRGAVITVVRTGSAAGTAAMLFTTSDGSAKSSVSRKCRSCIVPPPDYLKASGTLVFADRETTKTFTVPITDDGAIENDETVNLTLSAAKGGALPGPLTTAVLTIHDNDPNVSFERAASSGPEGVGSPRLRVLLSSPVGGASVAYSVTGGTATAGTDYTLAAGTLTFGARSSSIPLRVLDDDLKEESETVIVELSSPTNAELGPITTHTYTIKDDDPQGDVAGDTPASALTVDLVTQPRQVIGESLSPANSDVDVYRVHLEAGDDLAIDVDPRGSFDFYGNVIPGLQSSTVTILGPDGTTELAVVGGSEEPNGSGPTDNPAHLFHAETAGDYYLSLSSLQTGEKRGYRIELHRLALAEGKQAPAVLDQEGPMFAWLRGDTLGITGPTGYGFALVGNWTQTTGKRGSLINATYKLAAGETVTVRSVLGDLSVPVIEDIRFSTTANRWGDVFGPVDGAIPVRIGVPIGDFSTEAADVFGFLFQKQTGEIDQWKIQLGSDITASSLGQARNIWQVTPGAPYFLSLAKPPFKIKFGPIDTEKKAEGEGTVLILDPADPFFYINFIDDDIEYVIALSAQGLIPFHPELPPKRSAGVGLTDFYSQTFISAGGIPLLDLFKGAKVLLDVGEAVDLDANDDGSWLGGNGNADQLFRGDLAAIGAVMRDINVGLNGKVTVALGGGPLEFQVPIGKASAVYNGQEEAIWFRGTRGTENPFAGTPLSFLKMTAQDEIEGTIFSDGRFDVAAESRVDLLDAGELLMTLHLDNDVFEADVDGDIKLKASASIDTDFGSVSASCEATGHAEGSLAFSQSGGSLHMSGSLSNDGSIKCYYKGKKVASKSFHISGSIDDGRIRFTIPYIGSKSIRIF